MEEILRQSRNSLKVVGTLKSIKINEGTSKNGDPFVSLDVVVVSKGEDKIRENKISFWTRRNSKLAAGYITAGNEYKSIEKHGEENADRVVIDGNYEMNEYVKDGVFKSFPKLKGIFISRLDKNSTGVDDNPIPDAVELLLECVVMDTQPELSKEGLTTGRICTRLLSVGYNNAINEFNNVIVEEESGKDFKRLFPAGTTARLYININNYVVIKENEPVPTTQTFGKQLSNIGMQPIKEYINETVIIGGDMPVIDGKYTKEEIAKMVRLRELAINEKMSVPATPPAPTGFGSGFSADTTSSTPTALNLNDIPF